MIIGENADRLRTVFKKPVFKLSYLGILFAVVAYYLLKWGDRFYSLVSEANARAITWVFLCVCGANLIYIFIYYYIYQRMRVPVSFLEVFRIMSLARLGKYVPGKILFAGNYFLFSHEAGIGSKDAGTSLVISQCLWFLSGCIFTIPVISVLSSSLRYSIVFLPLVTGLVIHPRILNSILLLLGKIAQKFTRPEQEISFQISEHIGYALYAKVTLLYILGWVIAGLGVYFGALAFYPIGIKDLPICLSSVAISTIVGFIAIFAPAGLGVREGVGTAILTPVVSMETAFLVMLMLRLIGIIIELCFALFSVAFIRVSPAKKFEESLQR